MGMCNSPLRLQDESLENQAHGCKASLTGRTFEMRFATIRCTVLYKSGTVAASWKARGRTEGEDILELK
jgi:hypothetical protein